MPDQLSDEEVAAVRLIIETDKRALRGIKELSLLGGGAGISRFCQDKTATH